jgi:APA family basic amino acid/polyamine antiporter
VSASVALTLWAFLGMESGTVPAEEVVDPVRTIPRATLLGTLIVTVVYVLGTVVVMGLVEPAALATSTAPFADAARALLGPWGAYAMAAGAVVSTLGALNGWILISGQVPRAAARDGLLPGVFERLSSRATPRNAILISTAISSVMVAMNYTRGLVGAFTFMILLATVATLLPYVLSSAAVLLIEREGEGTAVSAGARGQPARAGAGLVVVASLAFLYSLWAVAGSGRDAVFWGFLLLLGGLPLYVGMARGRATGVR